MSSPIDQPQAPFRPAATAQASFYFAGFRNLNSTPIPDEFFDLLAVNLSEAELRVLLYIMRRTFGFKKQADAISLTQLTGGIRRRDGKILDHGTGLSKPAVLKAVGGLQAKGIITVEKRTGQDGRNEVNVYSLRFVEEQSNNLPPPGLAYLQNYSNAEYCSREQTVEDVPGMVAARNYPATGSTRGGYSSEGGKDKDKDIDTEIYRTQGVKPVYPGSKAALPPEFTATREGKGSLPGRVKPVDQAGKLEGSKGVKMVNLQHGSLQNSSKQDTVKQNLLLRAEGALALNMLPEDEAVEVEIDGDKLYIRFRELVLALAGLGLSEQLATELAYAYPEEYLWDKIELTRRVATRDSHQRTIRNTAGYLRRAIEQDYQPERSPAGGERAARGFEKAVRRFPAASAFCNSQPAEAGPENRWYASYKETGELEADYKGPGELESTAAENYPAEYTAPLPPIHRGAGRDTGVSRGAKAPATYLSSHEVARRPSGGAGGPGETGRGEIGSSRASESTGGEEYPALWEHLQADLAGRYRLGAEMSLLEQARLYIGQEREGMTVTRLVVKSAWQERSLSATARSAIRMALQQRIGPGYDLVICSE